MSDYIREISQRLTGVYECPNPGKKGYTGGQAKSLVLTRPDGYWEDTVHLRGQSAINDLSKGSEQQVVGRLLRARDSCYRRLHEYLSEWTDNGLHAEAFGYVSDDPRSEGWYSCPEPEYEECDDHEQSDGGGTVADSCGGNEEKDGLYNRVPNSCY